MLGDPADRPGLIPPAAGGKAVSCFVFFPDLEQVTVADDL